MSTQQWAELVGLPTGPLAHDTEEHSRQIALRTIVGLAQACHDSEVVCCGQYCLPVDATFPKGSQFAAFRKGPRTLTIAWKWEDDDTVKPHQVTDEGARIVK